MIERHITIEHSDTTDCHAYCWKDESKNPKAAIQIVHGMMEHAGRYAHFAEYLVNKGFVVYADDHPGHGKSISSTKELGHLDGPDGWNLILSNISKLNSTIIEENKNIPVILFGHSMGSILATHFASLYSTGLAGMVISGTNYTPALLNSAGMLMAKTNRLLFGKYKRSKLINQLAYGVFNSHFKPARTPFDWLSTDKQKVDLYIEDELCGNPSTTGFYLALFYGINQIGKTKTIANIQHDLPVLFIAGEKDPVGDFGKGVKKVYNRFENAGLTNLNLKLYKQGRHEMHNEVNRFEVYQNVLNWIDNIKQT